MRPKLTPHQREVYTRIRLLSRSRLSTRDGWISGDFVGSRGARQRLVEKGYIEARAVQGPRGGEHHYYRPIYVAGGEQ